MKTEFIQITRHLYEEPHQLNLVILASNGMASGGLEFYTNSDRLKALGKALIDFPSHERSNYLFEIGSERPEDRHAYYFRIRVFAKNNQSDCAIQLRMNNNNPPNHYQPKWPSYETSPQLTDFEIDSDANNIKKLGGLLIEFAKLEHQRLFWTPVQGVVDNELPFLDRRTGDVIESALAAMPDGL